jgi:uncharacterized protein YceH (UPF0502 family)
MVDVSLTAEEARVLGCLMEKSATTPDNYPLSMNALVTACNQTTNRDPVVVYDESTVERALEGLRTKDLSRRIRQTGARVVKHRHMADDAWQLHVPDFAVLGVLLLRGPQTPGELKQRTERWHSFRSLDDLEKTLERLAELGFVVQLGRRPGQKEQRWATTIVSVEAEPAAVPEAPAPIESELEVPRAPQARAIEIRNPATGELLRTIAVTEPGEITQKVERARRALSSWADRPYAERADVMRSFARLLESELDDCARVTTSEVGKPIRQARNEARAVLDRVAWNIDHVGDLLSPRDVTTNGDVRERITYEPVGVVVHISAWNYPYFVALNSVVPALLAGNAVV